ncbi:MAG: hypothetical protein WBA93_31900 [Microcoleaceae cyanobacterium]
MVRYATAFHVAQQNTPYTYYGALRYRFSCCPAKHTLHLHLIIIGANGRLPLQKLDIQ